jgi:hypothetical protein
MIAAIGSCTNTSNVMLTAEILARNAVKKGLKVKPYIKTSFLRFKSRKIPKQARLHSLDNNNRPPSSVGLEHQRIEDLKSTE